MNRLDFTHLGLGRRLVQFSDLHYKGNDAFAEKVIRNIHELEPDYVFFTGDLVEGQSVAHLPDALAHIESLRVPVYGVWGNHDPNDSESTKLFKKSFSKNGGRYVENEEVLLPEFSIFGCNNQNWLHWKQSEATTPRLFITHFPILADQVIKRRFDLALAGHSHGGQIRLPGIGALWLPYGVAGYDRGLFETNVGPLYVNVGVGTLKIPVRFLCRPELTVIET
ncbi:MAG: metallophosphoesterase [Verrucomicrobiota bacterium]